VNKPPNQGFIFVKLKRYPRNRELYFLPVSRISAASGSGFQEMVMVGVRVEVKANIGIGGTVGVGVNVCTA